MSEPDIDSRCILLLSGGSLVARNVLESIRARSDSWRVVTTNSISEAPMLDAFDRVHLCPQTEFGSGAYMARLREVVSMESPGLIIPCRDEDVLALSRFAEDATDGEADRSLCGSPEVSSVFLDKIESWRFSAKHQLPFADTLPSGSSQEELARFVEVHGFPLVCKPAKGFASRGVFLAMNSDQLAAANRMSAYVIQQYLGSGDEAADLHQNILNTGMPLFFSCEKVKYSIQAYVTRSGQTIDCCAFAHKMVGGQSVEVSRTQENELVSIGMKCAAAFSGAGLKGPLNIQCARAVDGSFLAYEFNGRFTGATAARLRLGYDEVGIAMREYLSSDLELYKGVHCDIVVRVAHGVPLNKAFIEELEASRRAQASWVSPE